MINFCELGAARYDLIARRRKRWWSNFPSCAIWRKRNSGLSRWCGCAGAIASGRIRETTGVRGLLFSDN